MFDRASRYYAISNAEHVTADGTRILYKQRRFLPQPAAAESALMTVVAAGERLDSVAARTLGDPLLFWRLADANGAMDPFALVTPGTRLAIPAIRLGGVQTP